MQSRWRERFSMDEFLEELAFSDTKLEFYDGRIVGFAGGSLAHGALCSRLNALFSASRRSGYEVYTSDVAIRVDDRTYVFPDLSYSSEPVAAGATHLVAPLAVAEVISPQSGRRDRVEKLDAYGRLPSLRDYLLVDSLARSVTLFSRAESGGLLQRDASDAEAVIRLTSVPVEFSIGQLYEALAL